MKKIISIIIAAIVLISSTLIINAKTSFSEKIFQEIGMSEKENKKNTDTFAKGENITIYNNQIKAIVDLSKLTSQNISEDEAFNIVAKRAVLLNKAEKSGYTVTFEEVENQISKERTMAEQASNYNDFLEYLKGAKQTVDEYWESQKTRAQGELIVEKYLKIQMLN